MRTQRGSMWLRGKASAPRCNDGAVCRCDPGIAAGPAQWQHGTMYSNLGSLPVRAALHGNVHIFEDIVRLQHCSHGWEVFRDKRRVCHAHAQHCAWPFRLRLSDPNRCWCTQIELHQRQHWLTVHTGVSSSRSSCGCTHVLQDNHSTCSHLIDGKRQHIEQVADVGAYIPTIRSCVLAAQPDLPDLCMHTLPMSA